MSSYPDVLFVPETLTNHLKIRKKRSLVSYELLLSSLFVSDSSSSSLASCLSFFQLLFVTVNLSSSLSLSATNCLFLPILLSPFCYSPFISPPSPLPHSFFSLPPLSPIPCVHTRFTHNPRTLTIHSRQCNILNGSGFNLTRFWKHLLVLSITVLYLACGLFMFELSAQSDLLRISFPYSRSLTIPFSICASFRPASPLSR